MSIRGKAYIVGAFEHPTRKAPDKSTAQLHAECARGALADAGLELRDVDAYFCAGDAPGLGALSMADYLGPEAQACRLHRHRRVRRTWSTWRTRRRRWPPGKCRVALITLAGRPRSEARTPPAANVPEVPFEAAYGALTLNMYAMVAARHMHEFGTTPEQLAWVKVAMSHHAQHNPHAMLRDVVTVADVLASPQGRRPAAQAGLLRRQRRRRRATGDGA